MTLGRTIFILILQLSFFAMGAALFATAVLLWFRPRRWWGYTMSKLGIFGIVMAVLFGAVLPAGQIPLTTLAVIYILGLLLSTVGVTVVSIDIIRRVNLMQQFPPDEKSDTSED